MKAPTNSVSEADLHAYVDGETSPERRIEIERFLARDPHQSARVDGWRRQNDVIRASYARVASEPLPVALSLTFPRAVGAQTGGPAPRPAAAFNPRALEIAPVVHASDATGAKSRLMLVALSSFFFGAMVIGSLAFFLDTRPARYADLPGAATILRPGPGSLDDYASSVFGARALEAHRTFVRDLIHPAEMSTENMPALTAWLSQRTALAIRPPDLSSDGFRLLGGRVTPESLGPAALLVYENGSGERLGLTIGRASNQDDMIPRFSRGRSVDAVTWVTSGTAFALTGAFARERLMRTAVRLSAESHSESR